MLLTPSLIAVLAYISCTHWTTLILVATLNVDQRLGTPYAVDHSVDFNIATLRIYDKAFLDVRKPTISACVLLFMCL